MRWSIMNLSLMFTLVETELSEGENVKWLQQYNIVLPEYSFIHQE